MVAAVIVLSLTALGGLAMAAIRFLGSPRPPTWIALVHGPLAAAGLGLLVYAIATESHSETADIALAVLALATIGGLTLFIGFHLRERPLPRAIVVLHGIVAAAGLALLVAAYGGA